MTDLSDLLARRMTELGIESVRELARRAQRHPGGAVDQSTIAMYLRGMHGMPSERTVECLAWVLDLDRDVLRAAARVPAPVDRFTLPPEADRLTERQRKAVIELVRSMVEGRP